VPQRQIRSPGGREPPCRLDERSNEHQADLQSRLVEADLPCDLAETVQITKWVYQQIEKANGQVCVEKSLATSRSNLGEVFGGVEWDYRYSGGCFPRALTATSVFFLSS
jgi:hypothetical protein